MLHSCEVEIPWADGQYRFRLGIGQLRELDEKTGVGPNELLVRIAEGRWRIADLRETLRLGLIGGGLAPVKALALVQRYVDDRPLFESIQPASRVLYAVLKGADDKSGKAPPTGAATAGATTEAV